MRLLVSLLTGWLVTDLSLLPHHHGTMLVAAQSNNNGCPLEIWAYASMNACVSRQDPEVRGQIRADGTCRETTILEDDTANNNGGTMLPGIYAAECVQGDDGQQNVRFLHSGCLYDDCAMTTSQSTALQRCDQNSRTLSVYYSRLAPPGLIPVTDWSFTEVGGRRCLGFTVDGQVLLAFSVIGTCQCNNNNNNPSPTPRPTRPPVPQPTLRPTRQPTLRPTRQPTPAPTPAPTRPPITSTTSPSRDIPDQVTLTPSASWPAPTWNPTQFPTSSPMASTITRSPTSSSITTTTTPSSTMDTTLFPTSTPAPSQTFVPTLSSKIDPLPTTPKPTSISLEEYTAAPQQQPNRNPDGIRGDAAAAANDNDNDTTMTNAVLLIISIIAAGGLSLCAVALVALVVRRRRQLQKEEQQQQQQQQRQGGPNSPTSATLPSPHDTPASLREISIRRPYAHERQDENTISTLGDPAAGMMLGQGVGGYGEESTADPVRLFDHHPAGHGGNDEEGTVTSIYTSGTDMRFSKDDTSLEDAYFATATTTTGGDAPGMTSLKQDEFHVEAPPGPLGLLMTTYDGRLRVHKIKEDSIFATTGVRVGDYLNALDNVEVKFMTPSALASLVQARGQASRLFTFERQSDPDHHHDAGAANDSYSIDNDDSDVAHKNYSQGQQHEDDSTKIHC